MLPTSEQHTQCTHARTDRTHTHSHIRGLIIYQTRSTARTTRTQFRDTREPSKRHTVGEKKRERGKSSERARDSRELSAGDIQSVRSSTLCAITDCPLKDNKLHAQPKRKQECRRRAVGRGGGGEGNIQQEEFQNKSQQFKIARTSFGVHSPTTY